MTKFHMRVKKFSHSRWADSRARQAAPIGIAIAHWTQTSLNVQVPSRAAIHARCMSRRAACLGSMFGAETPDSCR
jgi:hypothetical protein